MKRFHVHLQVADLAGSIRFYTGLFAAEAACAPESAACTPDACAPQPKVAAGPACCAPR